jgi:hypothetical protein
MGEFHRKAARFGQVTGIYGYIVDFLAKQLFDWLDLDRLPT